MSRFPADRLTPDGYPGPGIDLPVFYGDLDTYSHVNNVAVGRYFEQARLVALHSLGLWDAVPGAQTLAVQVTINYLATIDFGTPVHVRSRLGRLGTSSIALEQGLWQGGTCRTLADTTVVVTKDGRPVAIPDDVRAALVGRSGQPQPDNP